MSHGAFRGYLVVAFLALSFLALLPARPVAAQDGEDLAVHLTLSGTLRDGARGSYAQADVPERPGDAKTLHLFAKAADPFGVAMGAVPAQGLSDYTHAWTLQVRRLVGGVGTATVEVSWSRKQLPVGSVEAGDHRTITLKEGERHVLDFISVPGGKTANAVLELEAVHVAQPRLASEMLTYDLWLVHATRTGERVTRQVTLSGLHGQPVTYDFEPPAFPIATSNADAAALELSVSGTVKAWVRADGRLEVTLVSRRSLIVSAKSGAAARKTHVGGADIGEKTFLAKPGETTGVELPTPKGALMFAPTFTPPANLQPGITKVGAWLQVSREEFFGDGRTTILVMVSRR